MFMMLVAAGVYSAGASVRGDLQRAIPACSRGTCYSGLDLYDIGACIGFDSGLHRLVDENWSVTIRLEAFRWDPNVAPKVAPMFLILFKVRAKNAQGLGCVFS